jgi:hypothetical protein
MPEDQSRANLARRERERLAKLLLDLNAPLSPEDRRAAAKLLTAPSPDSGKRTVKSEAEHIAVCYFDHLRKGIKRLSAERRIQLAKDAIALAEHQYPSCRSTIKVSNLLGTTSRNGLVDAKRNEAMRKHFRAIMSPFDRGYLRKSGDA